MNPVWVPVWSEEKKRIRIFVIFRSVDGGVSRGPRDHSDWAKDAAGTVTVQ